MLLLRRNCPGSKHQSSPGRSKIPARAHFTYDLFFYNVGGKAPSYDTDGLLRAAHFHNPPWYHKYFLFAASTT